MPKHNQRGASLVEYAILIALIAMVCIAAITSFSTPQPKDRNPSGNVTTTTAK